MIEKDQCVAVGYINKPHGIKGEIVFSLLDGFYSEDIDTNFLLLNIDNGLVPFRIESIRTKSSKTLLVKLNDVNSEDKARDLCDAEVYLKPEEILKEEEAPSGAFIGFKVNDASKGQIGTILDINEIAKNPIFIIENEGKEILIPINQDFITKVDELTKTIEMDLPEGLIDLYLEG
ncbi:ribosome maturation factor RimM [Plebeiibacterium marinum]|uniref:Ribosome maturation factor RimM n=1 Tax=Plebeiibacterium marinum TaxID=2992111 RepID=A0AAE3MCJ6_9BACT|nr:ribosome maturation factor RimM [Plebeiobacterium marinum]MCW3805273.1 ribosome maturation factor RimM [Plebeiobacterium marinum]